MGAWDGNWEPFPSILGLFWAFGGAACKTPGAGCKTPGAVCKTPGAGCKTQGAGCKTPGPAGSFWEVLAVASGSLLGSIFGSGFAREALASHFGPFFTLERSHSVSTSHSDPRNGPKTNIFEVADVAEV